MTDQTAAPAPDSPPPADPPPARKFSTLGRIATTVIALAAIVVGVIKLFGISFALPSCDSSSAKETVRGLFKSKDIELVVFNAIEEISKGDGKTLCGAHVESADNAKANIQYSITWQGWSPYMTIEKVDEIPAEG